LPAEDGFKNNGGLERGGGKKSFFCSPPLGRGDGKLVSDDRVKKEDK